MKPTKIDIYNHVMPPSYLALGNQHGKEPGMVRRMNSLRMLWDMEARVEMLNAWPEVQQIITLAGPSPESPTRAWLKSAAVGPTSFRRLSLRCP